MTDHFQGGDIKTAGKLLILEKYLPAYLSIMESNWKGGEIWYVDTHAGSGKTVVEEGIKLDGSPIVALRQDDPGFDRYYLFEKDESHFMSLVDTLEFEFNLDFEVRPTLIDAHDFLVAKSSDPYVKILQIDSNPGVQFLAQESESRHHWFTFLDPGGLDLHIETVDKLIDRGKMDMLINFQVTGVKRSAAADHAEAAATATMGRDDLDGGRISLDELTRKYCERLRSGRDDWQVTSKAMEDPMNRRYRFDMVFAARADVATKIIREIWESDDFWVEAHDLIDEQREVQSQSRLGDF
jgi:three-Cys-motif partner protein